jgi:deoxyribodipyrimidine photo-lyase
VPCWIASPKQEFGAYTLRPKLHKLIPEFLDTFPEVTHQKNVIKIPKKYSEWKKISANKSVNPIVPGESAAKKQLNYFFANGLVAYDNDRNDPNSNAQSGLSPYLHYGNVAAQRIVLELLIGLRSLGKNTRMISVNIYILKNNLKTQKHMMHYGMRLKWKW